MNLDEMLSNVTVIGAAGKMGSGIATLLAQELANLKIKNPDKIYKVNLIDVNEQGLAGLRDFINTQLVKIAEKSIVSLRAVYESRDDLVENWEIIDAFVNEALGILRFGTELSNAKNSQIVFEAVIEKEELKIKILKELSQICTGDTLFFTNTSSIPIGFLDQEVGLQGRIIGYHFYNPPIVQKLVEIIIGKDTRSDIKELAYEMGKRLRKKLIPSNDIAGFIGNGHFSRDGLFGIAEVQRIQDKYSFSEAIYIVNRITQDFLIRPMGIFQLIDYVGIDVFQSILRVMNKHLGEPSLQSDLIDAFMQKNIRGGQHADGSQKDGFLQYKKSRPIGIFDLQKNEYIDFEELKKKCNPIIGDPPAGFSPWRKLMAAPDKETVLSNYFSNLQSADGVGSDLARNFLSATKKIGEKLVEDGVANNKEDVNEVLINGFYWLYGPINDYI